MRFPTLLLGVAGAMLLTGCSTLVSMNPFVTDKESVLDPNLAGIWHATDGDDTYIIKQKGNAYTILCVDDSVTKFEARLLDAGDAKLVDLAPVNDDPFQIPAHTLMRVWIEGPTLRMAFLNTDWLKQQAALQLPVQAIKDRTVITAPGNAVRDFLLNYGADPRAAEEPAILERAR